MGKEKGRGGLRGSRGPSLILVVIVKRLCLKVVMGLSRLERVIRSTVRRLSQERKGGGGGVRGRARRRSRSRGRKGGGGEGTALLLRLMRSHLIQNQVQTRSLMMTEEAVERRRARGTATANVAELSYMK
ncbi:unnamed protein product [Brassica rapa subsp. trilocularis]